MKYKIKNINISNVKRYRKHSNLFVKGVNNPNIDSKKVYTPVINYFYSQINIIEFSHLLN